MNKCSSRPGILLHVENCREHVFMTRGFGLSFMNKCSSQSTVSVRTLSTRYPFAPRIGTSDEYLFISDMNNYSSQSILGFQQNDEMVQVFNQRNLHIKIMYFR